MQRKRLLFLGKPSYSFLSLNWLPAFCFLHFQCHEISPGFSLTWRFFCQHHFLWDIFILFLHLLFSFMSTSLSLLSSSGYICRVPWMAALSTFPQSAISFVILFTFNLNFTSSVITFHFFAEISSFLANFLFSLFILVNSTQICN